LEWRVKKILNKKFYEHFPTIDVITKNGKFTGKIESIFDKKALQLRNNFEVVVIPWKLVEIIRLSFPKQED
ncbi:hypothetical protein DRO97_07150, partial [Archaeoglobales archaeon]